MSNAQPDSGSRRDGAVLASHQFTDAAPPTAAVEQADQAAVDCLQDDEVVILLLRPSLWYVVLEAMGALAVIAGLTVALGVASLFAALPWSAPQALALGLTVGLIRIGWQTLDWTARLYILTDRRVLTRAGALRADIESAHLRDIERTEMVPRIRERPLALGTIAFVVVTNGQWTPMWTCIRQPKEVQQVIDTAIRRYGRH